MVPCGLLGPGERGEIMIIREASGGHGADRLEELGLRVGRTVEMLNNGGSALLLKVDEARIALARKLAMTIMVKEIKK